MWFEARNDEDDDDDEMLDIIHNWSTGINMLEMMQDLWPAWITNTRSLRQIGFTSVFTTLGDLGRSTKS